MHLNKYIFLVCRGGLYTHPLLAYIMVSTHLSLLIDWRYVWILLSVVV